MKYLRLFENIKEPKVGDYVICDESRFNAANIIDKAVDLFLSMNVGQVVEIDKEKENAFMVHYEKIPKNIRIYFTHKGCREMHLDEIVCWNSDKEILAVLVDAKKYNL